MPRKTTKPTIEYRIVQAELWGNARDGFEINNWYTLERWKSTSSVTNRHLLRLARNQFEGRNFNWSEGRNTSMSRDGIELEDIGAESMLDVTYRGHKIGEVQWSELCEHCGEHLQVLPDTGRVGCWRANCIGNRVIRSLSIIG
jgi:hypothetical protein